MKLNLLAKLKQYGFCGLIRNSALYFSRNIIKLEIQKFHYLENNISYTELNNKFDYSLNIKEISYNDFLLGDKEVFTPSKLKLVHDRLKDTTYKAFGITDDGKLIYSCWISLSKMGLPVKSNYLLKSNEGLLEDAYCHPNYRGTGLHSKMNIYRLLKIYEYGKTKAIAIVLDGNNYAYRSQITAGFKETKTFYIFKFLGITFTTLNND